MLVILSHCQNNILLIISLDILHIHTIPSNNRWVEQKQKTFQDQRICYFLYSAQFHWAVVVFKPCTTEQEKENDKPHGKGGLCGETLHFYIVVYPHCLSWLQTERHPGLLKPNSHSVCTDAAWWSNLTVLFAYLDALTTSIRNATCVVREDICCAIFIV